MYARANGSRADKVPSQDGASRPSFRQSPATQHPSIHSFLDLQQTIGNQATARLLRARLEGDASVPPVVPGRALSPSKTLRIGAPKDTYEQEAGHVADQVMSKTEAQPQRFDFSGGGDAKRTKGRPTQGPSWLQVRRTQAGAASDGAVPPIVHEVLNQPGQPLDASTRAFMEPRFGHDFGKVRVHTDARAAQSASAVNARAYTAGRSVVFGAGEFVPGTDAGKRLLAHELTHLLQQHAGSPVLQRQPEQGAQSTDEDLELPWKHDKIRFFETESSGIRFLVGVSGQTQEVEVRAAIPAIGKQIAADNSLIKDPSFRVMTCFIVGETSTQFVLWKGNPVIKLNADKKSDMTAEVAAHEMGHAIFYALGRQAESAGEDATLASDFRLGVADIYARLMGTKLYSEGKEKPHPAGILIADPSQWAAGAPQKPLRQDPGSQHKLPRAVEKRTAERRTAKERAAEKRAAEDPLAEERAAEKREAEERAAEKRAAEKREAEKREAEAREYEKRRDEAFEEFARDVPQKVQPADVKPAEDGGVQETPPAEVIPTGEKTTEEHPWDDPGELFASAKEAYQVNPKGLKDAITRFKKIDPKVEAPWNELLALVKAFVEKKHTPPIKVPQERTAVANKALNLETRSTVPKLGHEQYGSRGLLYWLLYPGQRPGRNNLTEPTD